MVVNLRREKRPSQRFVHQLVAENFCRKTAEPCEVNHINEKPYDNRACNLEYVTHQENITFGTVQHRIMMKKKINNSDEIGAVKRTERGCRNGRLAVSKYSIDGDFICSYKSASDASKAIKGSAVLAHYISFAARNGAISGGYRWAIKDKSLKQLSYASPKKPCACISEDGSIVAAFGSIKEASDKTGYSRSKIAKSIRNPNIKHNGSNWVLL